jgi:hypothetical protein
MNVDATHTLTHLNPKSINFVERGGVCILQSAQKTTVVQVDALERLQTQNPVNHLEL